MSAVLPPRELPPLPRAQILLLTTALALATFMEILDLTIVNVSVPNIAGNLGVSPTTGTWAISSYAMAAAIVQPITGWLGRRYGEVRAFMTSLTLFMVFSLVCGLATSMNMLIAARIIQGLVSGPMIGIGQALLLRNYPPAKRGQAMSIWALVVLIAPICGPLMGGWITDHLSWRWLFFINLPIGLIAWMFCWSILKDRETEVVTQPVDRLGLTLLIIGVASLQYVLDKGNENDWFNSTEIVVVALIALVSLTYLIVWELNNDHPVIDLHLFKDHNFTIGIICMSLGYCTHFSNNVMFPLWLQTAMGYTAIWAGVAMAPVGVLAILTTPAIGRNMQRMNHRVASSVAFVMMALCSWWIASLNQHASLLQIAMPRFVVGSAMSLFFLPVYQILMSNVETKDLAAATGMSNFMRTMAASLGTSASVWLWSDRTEYHRTILSESLNPTAPAWAAGQAAMSASGLPLPQQLSYAEHLLTQESQTLGINDLYVLYAMIFLGLAGLIWLARPPFTAAQGRR